MQGKTLKDHDDRGIVIGVWMCVKEAVAVVRKEGHRLLSHRVQKMQGTQDVSKMSIPLVI